MRIYQRTSVIAFTLLALVAGCSQEPTASDGETSAAVTLANAVCPITGSPVDKAVTVKWDGKIVGFCCADCIPGWNELSDVEKATKLAAANAEGTSEHEQAHETTTQ